MKRGCMYILTVFIFSTVLFSFANGAQARRWHHRYYHPHQYKHQVGVSTWCQKNPGKCHKRLSTDPKVNTKREHCMDLKGNYDGYVSAWERMQFDSECK